MKINSYKDLISSVYLFNTFSPDEIICLFKDEYYNIKSYDKGQIVYLQNESCNTIDIILDGKIAIQKIDEEGHILTVATFGMGDIMGGSLAFSNNNEYPMTVISISESIILHIEKELIFNLCQSNRKFLIKFLETLSSKALILTDKIGFMSMKSIRDKIIEFLNYEYHMQKNTRIILNITKKELAEKFGVQRPSLFRELKKMKEEGFIDYNSKYIVILNRDMFENI